MMNNLNKPIYWTELLHQDWCIHLAATSKGLVCVGSNHFPIEELRSWVTHRFPAAPFLRDDEKLKPYAAEIVEYLEGRRHQFNLPVDLQGTAFQQEVWQALCEIPYGRTCSYSDIAERIGRPSSARAVGTAIGANPALICIPCHRVVGKHGALTGYRGGIDMKASLLKLEQEGPEQEGFIVDHVG